MVKNPVEYDRDTLPAELMDFFAKFLPVSLVNASGWMNHE
jgi:hypothetical protein